jgi:hypothetical protein
LVGTSCVAINFHLHRLGSVSGRRRRGAPHQDAGSGGPALRWRGGDSRPRQSNGGSGWLVVAVSSHPLDMFSRRCHAEDGDRDIALYMAATASMPCQARSAPASTPTSPLHPRSQCVPRRRRRHPTGKRAALRVHGEHHGSDEAKPLLRTASIYCTYRIPSLNTLTSLR